MPKGTRRKTTDSAVTIAETNAINVVQPDLPDAAQAIQFPEGKSPEEKSAVVSGRGQFRSWIVDTRRGYSGLTDEENNYLVLQFAEKPHPDLLAAVKGAGFHFKPDHCGLKNVWVRRNDFHGRLSVQLIEKLIRSLVPVPASLAL